MLPEGGVGSGLPGPAQAVTLNLHGTECGEGQGEASSLKTGRRKIPAPCS